MSIVLTGAPQTSSAFTRQPKEEEGMTNDETPLAPVTGEAVHYLPAYRDTADVRALRRKDLINLILGLLCLLTTATAALLYFRKPEVIVVNGATGRVVMMGQQTYADEETVKLTPDAPTFEDEKYLVTTFLTYLYRVDLTSRQGDLSSALRLMLPESATALSQFMTKNQVLQTQFEQQWKTDFTIEHLERVPGRNLSVQAVGRQNITKVVGGAVVKESKQYLMTVDLLVDKPDYIGGPRRKDRNLRTGFVVERLDVQEINPATTPSAAATTSRSTN